MDGRRGQKGGTSRTSIDRNQCLEGCEGQQGVEEPPPPRLPLSVSDQSAGGLGQGPSRSKVTWAACWWPGSVWDLHPGCLKHPG